MKTEQIDKLYKECPGAMASVEDYLDGHMRSTPQGIAELEALKAQFGDNKKASTRIFMAMGDRFLYEFLDEKGIYVYVEPYWALSTQGDGGGVIKWLPQVIGHEGLFDPCDKRQAAEIKAFEVAIKLLESKLG